MRDRWINEVAQGYGTLLLINKAAQPGGFGGSDRAPKRHSSVLRSDSESIECALQVKERTRPASSEPLSLFCPRSRGIFFSNPSSPLWSGVVLPYLPPALTTVGHLRIIYLRREVCFIGCHEPCDEGGKRLVYKHSGWSCEVYFDEKRGVDGSTMLCRARDLVREPADGGGSGPGWDEKVLASCLLKFQAFWRLDLVGTYTFYQRKRRKRCASRVRCQYSFHSCDPPYLCFIIIPFVVHFGASRHSNHFLFIER